LINPRLFARVQLRILGLLGRTSHHLDSNNYQSEYCTLLDQARETRGSRTFTSKTQKATHKGGFVLNWESGNVLLSQEGEGGLLLAAQQRNRLNDRSSATVRESTS